MLKALPTTNPVNTTVPLSEPDMFAFTVRLLVEDSLKVAVTLSVFPSGKFTCPEYVPLRGETSNPENRYQTEGLFWISQKREELP